MKKGVVFYTPLVPNAYHFFRAKTDQEDIKPYILCFFFLNIAMAHHETDTLHIKLKVRFTKSCGFQFLDGH